MRATAARWLAPLLLPLLCACATVPPGLADPRDPWEGWNRQVFQLNDWFDRHFLRPAAVLYDGIVPDAFQRGIRNARRNLSEPRRIVAHLLQGHLRQSLTHAGRLLLNSTLGLAGLSDAAVRVGLKGEDTGFGEVLGAWGMPPGPYLVLPGVGASTVRDSFALAIDGQLLAPETFLISAVVRYSISGIGLLQQRTDLLGRESLLFGDRYLLLREFYLGDDPSAGGDEDASGSAAGAAEESDIFDF